MTPSEFPFRAFAEPDRSSRTVNKLHELFLSSGTTHDVDEFSHALASSLHNVPDPDRAVSNLLRFVEATLSMSSLFNDLLAYPVLMDVLVKMLSHSQYFADILVRDPELFRWLTASDALIGSRNREFLHTEVQRAMRVFQRPERKLDSLRRLYRREVLRIGARDVLGEAGLATVTEELSHLADVLVDAACIVAEQQVQDRFPQKPDTPYAVIGLGKLGGGELNYSSDIDIVFVYGDEGELVDARGSTRTYHEYFNALVEKMVQNLSGSSVEGHLYQVDLRLRPESGAGPLARSVRSYLLYYESRGELWERQMLLKARAIAGDIAFGEECIRQLEPFVFPRTFFQNPKEYIARIKARIEASIAGEENVKLRAGGIRDIEFIVQALQLVNGGKNRSIRARRTLDAITQLGEASLLSGDEKATLTEAYVFFRTLEHRLQTMLNTQTHEIPAEQLAKGILARKMGFVSAEELARRNDTLLAAVRKIFENVLNVETPPAAVGLTALFAAEAGVDSAARLLGDYGFADPNKASKNLLSMAFGTGGFGLRELDARAREAFREIAETVLRQIAATPIPDMTLHNLALIATAQPFPEHIYTQLKEENFRNLMLRICSTSTRFANGLARKPLLLETLASDKRALVRAGLDVPKSIEKLPAFKNSEELRSGIRYVLGISSFDELTAELTEIADASMEAVVAEEKRNIGGRLAPFAVLALGKYGSGELNFDADLDVLFVGEAKTPAAQERLERLARAIVGRMSRVSAEGKLYDIDARLRPEGRSAPLVVDREAYLNYLYTRASLWERQSLTRLRIVAGSPQLGEEVSKTVETFVYESPLPQHWVEDIVAMRRKTETRSRVRGSQSYDIKLGAGGMVDVEFLVQMLQMHFGRTMPSLRGGSTIAFIERKELSLPLLEEAGTFAEAYRLYRQIETMIRIGLDDRGSVIAPGDKLDLLARLLGYPTGEELLHRIASTMSAVRRLFIETSSRLSDHPLL